MLVNPTTTSNVVVPPVIPSMPRPLVPIARITFSNARENACTCGLPKTAPTALASLLPARQTILTCNSLLDDDLDEVIAQLRARMQNLKLEIHLATAALPRWSPKIQQLPADVKLIIIIDKMDASRINALQIFDQRIEEYRIIPSKTYTVDYFLRELPAFVQRKMTWAFLPGTQESSPFTSIDDLQASLSQVTRWPLSSLSLSSTQAYAPLSINAWPVGDSRVWISSNNTLLPDQRTYLQKIASALEENEIYYFVGQETWKLSSQIQKNRRNRGKEFYFLENCLMSVEVWNDFRQSPFYELLDHFSWNEYLQTRQLLVCRQPNFGNVPAPSMSDFIDQCRKRYARHPDTAFYNDFFSFFEPHVRLRTWSVRALEGLSHLTIFKPGHPVRRFLNSMSDKVSNYHFAVMETEQAMEKVTRRALSRGYWSIHRFYWLGYRGAWMFYELMWRGMDVLWFLYECMWRVADFFWLIYKYVLSPVIGFARTLVDQPASWNDKPLPERWVLRTQHVGKKFGWLILKALRLR